MSWLITPQQKVAVDPYFSNVSLLLHGDGTNGSTTIIDSSPSPKTVTVEGNARISTDQSKFGGSSLVAGSAPSFLWGANRLTLPPGASFAYGVEDFTVEAWLWIPSFGDRSFWSQTVSGTNYFVCGVSSTGTPFLTFATSGAGTAVTGPSITLATWSHVAIVRSSGVAKVYSNGISGVGVVCSQNFNNTTFVPTIGSYNHNATQVVYAGYIDELRITKGIARYTANFIPPTAPFPDS